MSRVRDMVERVRDGELGIRGTKVEGLNCLRQKLGPGLSVRCCQMNRLGGFEATHQATKAAKHARRPTFFDKNASTLKGCASGGKSAAEHAKSSRHLPLKGWQDALVLHFRQLMRATG